MRLVVCALLILSASGDPLAESRAGFRAAERLFAGVFQPPTVGRQRAANRTCEGCEARPGTAHVVIDSERLTDAFLARHSYQSNGGEYGDNAAVGDFWYDAVHRRIFSRSLVLHEVDDPADLRLGRAPGTYPNTLDFGAELPSGTTIGHVGFVRWTQNGFGAYFAALQGTVRDANTGFLDLATATAGSGRTRTESHYGPEDLIKHVRLHPSGQLEVGYDTDPAARPESSLLVRGHAHVEGDLLVDGALHGGGVLHACSMRSGVERGRVAAARCEPGRLAIAGGGTCASGEMRGSRPTQAGDAPDGWEVTCSRDGVHQAYVICCAR